MIVITGATGQLGSRIVDRLLERVPAATVGVSVRDVDKAADSPSAACGCGPAISPTPPPWTDAFEGAEQVLVVSAAIRGPGAVAANIAAIDAARAAGREAHPVHEPPGRVAGLAVRPAAHPRRDRGAPGRAGVPFTALRNGFYASTLGHYLDEALETGRLVAPAGRPGLLDRARRPGRGAAAALAEPGVLDGVTPPLTAPETLDFDGRRRHPQRPHRPHGDPRRRRATTSGRPRQVDRRHARAGRRVHPRHVPRGPPGRVRRHRPDPGDRHRSPGHVRPLRAGVDAQASIVRSLSGFEQQIRTLFWAISRGRMPPRCCMSTVPDSIVVLQVPHMP